MSTITTTGRTPTPSAVSAKLAIGIGILVAIAVTVLFLVGTGHGAQNVPRVTALYHSTPLYHGTGAPPVVHHLAVAPAETTTARGYSIPGYSRAEHSYGTVP